MLNARAGGLFVTAASIAILGAAFAFQYIGGLAPCVLCSLLAFALAKGPVARLALVVAGLGLVIGAGTAVFHVGVEQQWWQGTAECGGIDGASLTLEQLKAQILAAPVVRCDDVAWSLFGISMAGYNVLLSLGLALVAFAAARGGGRRRR
jgi:disulfide bond formation protein DsbB